MTSIARAAFKNRRTDILDFAFHRGIPGEGLVRRTGRPIRQAGTDAFREKQIGSQPSVEMRAKNGITDLDVVSNADDLDFDIAIEGGDDFGASKPMP